MLEPSPWTGRQRLLRGEVEKLFVLLPYLKTSDEIRLRGIQFMPLRNAKRSRSKDAAAIRALASMFYLRDDIRIVDMSYAVIDARSAVQGFEEIDMNLDILSTLLGYRYTSPGRQPREPFLRFEHATVFRFVRSVLPRWRLGIGGSKSLSPTEFDRKQPDQAIEGFEGWTERREDLLLTSSSRIYPPSRDFWLNISQDLRADVPGAMGWPRAERRLPILFSPKRALQPELEARVLRSIRWYCSSAEIAATPEQALVRMAIAFETLLQLDRDAKAKDLYRRIRLLIGPVPRLDSWSQQFYRARSMVVHEGVAQHTAFLAVDARQADAASSGRAPAATYRRLIDYARLLFRPCVQAMLWGGVTSFDLRLNRLFFHNQQRLESICRLLKQKDPEPDSTFDELAELVGSLADARWDSDHITQIDAVTAAGREVLASCEKRISSAIRKEIAPEIKDLRACDQSESMESLISKWQMLAKRLGEAIRDDSNSLVREGAESEPTNWVELLLSFADYAGTMRLKAWAFDRWEADSPVADEG